MSVQLRIHIAHVGYEALRISKPLIDMQADRIYLIRMSHNDTAGLYYQKIKEELAKYQQIQVREEHVDIFDLYQCLEKYREIIQIEKGNQIFINVSTGSKISAIAGMLTCMLWKATPYYCKVQYIEPPKKIERLPTEFVSPPGILPSYKITKPSNAAMVVVNILQKNNDKMNKGRLMKYLVDEKIIKAIDVDENKFSGSAKHSQLRSILEPMENVWKYIEIKGVGKRSEVILTEQGKNALKIFGCESIEVEK